MELNVQSPATATALLAVPVFSDDDARGAAFDQADALVGGRLTSVADEEDFKAKPGSSLLIHTGGDAARVLLVGLGKRAEADGEGFRKFGAATIREANKRRLMSAAAMIASDALTAEAQASAVAEGALLGAYQYTEWKTKGVKENTCATFSVATDGPVEFGAQFARAAAVVSGVNLARDLVNGPPVQVTPTFMAETAQTIAREHGLAIQVFDEAALKDAGMNLILAVSAGSDEEARLIHLTYTPEGATDDTPSIALVGKGLTFDAGGYNIKPTGSIEDMKMDMAGGAAVLGAMKAIAQRAPKGIIVHGIVPSSENLINGSATKLADIVRSLNGKTVEILNTDAEGRLILADALCYAERLGVDRIVDLATLTGACMVALGPYTAGLWSNNDAFAEAIKAAAAETGESFWQMPLTKRLRSMLDSPNADLKNIGKRWGGAITAALFLQEFVGETDWAHLDIAGPAFTDSADIIGRAGGTGFAVRTLAQLVEAGV